MATKIRKQIYLDAEQDRLLKNISRKSGLSEAEIIRKAIDRQAVIPLPQTGRHDVWKKEAVFIKGLMRKGVVKGKRSWDRLDLYER